MPPGVDMGRWRISYPLLIGVPVVVAVLAIAGQWLGLVVLIGGMAVFTLVANWPEEIRENGLFLALVSFAGCVIVLGSLGATARLAFYSATAQVIPVLFLAMAVGSRLSLLGQGEPERRIRLILIYAFILGEAYSLDALASGHPGSQSFGIVVGALVAAAIAITSEIVGREGNEMGDNDDSAEDKDADDRQTP